MKDFEIIKKVVKPLCERYEIERMYLFGSSVSNGLAMANDIDFLISFKQLPVERYTDNYFELHEALERLFGKKVDLITENSLSNPFFIEQIETTRQLVYAA